MDKTLDIKITSTADTAGFKATTQAIGEQEQAAEKANSTVRRQAYVQQEVQQAASATTDEERKRLEIEEGIKANMEAQAGLVQAGYPVPGAAPAPGEAPGGSLSDISTSLAGQVVSSIVRDTIQLYEQWKAIHAELEAMAEAQNKIADETIKQVKSNEEVLKGVKDEEEAQKAILRIHEQINEQKDKIRQAETKLEDVAINEPARLEEQQAIVDQLNQQKAALDHQLETSTAITQKAIERHQAEQEIAADIRDQQHGAALDKSFEAEQKRQAEKGLSAPDKLLGRERDLAKMRKAFAEDASREMSVDLPQGFDVNAAHKAIAESGLPVQVANDFREKLNEIQKIEAERAELNKKIADQQARATEQQGRAMELADQHAERDAMDVVNRIAKQAKEDAAEEARAKKQEARRNEALLDLHETTAINRAKITGNDELVTRLEKQRDLRQEILRLENLGIDATEAEARAGEAISAKYGAEAARHTDNGNARDPFELGHRKNQHFDISGRDVTDDYRQVTAQGGLTPTFHGTNFSEALAPRLADLTKQTGKPGAQTAQASGANEVGKAANEVDKAATEVDKAATELDKAATELGKAAKEEGKAATEVNSAALELKANASQLAAAGRDLSAAASELSGAMSGVQAAIAEVKRAVGTLASQASLARN